MKSKAVSSVATIVPSELNCLMALARKADPEMWREEVERMFGYSREASKFFVTNLKARANGLSPYDPSL